LFIQWLEYDSIVHQKIQSQGKNEITQYSKQRQNTLNSKMSFPDTSQISRNELPNNYNYVHNSANNGITNINNFMPTVASQQLNLNEGFMMLPMNNQQEQHQMKYN